MRTSSLDLSCIALHPRSAVRHPPLPTSLKPTRSCRCDMHRQKIDGDAGTNRQHGSRNAVNCSDPRARMWGKMMMMAVAAIAALVLGCSVGGVRAERLTPSLAPTYLPFVNGLPTTAMLLTRTSMPPGLTATSMSYTPPTPEQLADDHAARVWVAPMIGSASSVPLTFLVSRVAEIVAANLVAFLGTPFFALRMFNGSVAVYEADVGAGTSDGDVYAPPYWLPGVYTEMTAGESHMCFLTIEQHAECRTTTPGFQAPSALMAARSNVTYTQLAAASRFTCGLRAVDQLVECFGLVGSDGTPGPVHMNYTSSIRYVNIAAQYENGFCGVVADTGAIACYSVISTTVPERVVMPAPSSPDLKFVYPLWQYLNPTISPFDQACAMKSDGFLNCFSSAPVGNNPPRAMSQATMMKTIVMGATTDNGQLQHVDELIGWISDPAVAVFEILRFVAVDPDHGNDSLCASINTQSPAEMLTLVPCATLPGALERVLHPNTWVQLLPASYTHNTTELVYGATTIASVPPTCFTPDEIGLLGNGSWAARMAATAGQAATLNCTGTDHCFRTMQNAQFVGLTFTGSLKHALWSYSDTSTNTYSHLPPSTIAITDCVFVAMGAVLLKTNGSATITGCTITNSLPWANTTLGLIELEDASLAMSGTTFSHNHLPVSPTFLRSCLRSDSLLPVTISITDSHWLDNRASSLAKPSRNGAVGVLELVRISGGVALQVHANGPLVLNVVDSTFKQQEVRCVPCNGGQSGTDMIATCLQLRSLLLTV